MKAKTAAAKAPWTIAMARAFGEHSVSAQKSLHDDGREHAEAEQRTQRRDSKSQAHKANAMLTQPMVMPARRWPCSMNLSPAEESQG